MPGVISSSTCRMPRKESSKDKLTALAALLAIERTVLAISSISYGFWKSAWRDSHGACFKARLGSAQVITKRQSVNRPSKCDTTAADRSYGGSRSNITTLGLQDRMKSSIFSGPADGSTPQDFRLRLRRTNDTRSMTSVFQRISATSMFVFMVLG